MLCGRLFCKFDCHACTVSDDEVNFFLGINYKL